MAELPRRTRIAAIICAIASVAALAGGTARYGVDRSRNDIVIALLLCVMIVLVEKFKVDFPHAAFDLNVSVSAILALAAGLTFGPVLAALVVIVGTLIDDVWDRLRPIQIVVNASNLGLATFFAALSYGFVAHEQYSPLHDLRNMLAAVVASFVYTMINTWGLAIVVAPVVGESTVGMWKSNFSATYLLVALPALGSLIPVVAKENPLALLILFVPLLGSHLAQRALRKVQLETQATIESLADALEVRDEYTHNHSVRVTEYVQGILDQLPHLPEGTRKMIRDAARIHDVGKMGVRDDALLKPGKLTDEEYEEIKRHPVIGADLIGNLEMYRRSVPIVRHHHERWDGKGYPDGVRGEDIPLGARIIAVADSFDAMTSDRPYRRAMAFEVALAEIRRYSGIQFDPQVVQAFEQALREPLAARLPKPADEPAKDPTKEPAEAPMSAVSAA
jgi:HD-GYP domain-containing protein (c-di-GMP phosphodiesterase class II)